MRRSFIVRICAPHAGNDRYLACQEGESCPSILVRITQVRSGRRSYTKFPPSQTRRRRCQKALSSSSTVVCNGQQARRPQGSCSISSAVRFSAFATTGPWSCALSRSLVAKSASVLWICLVISARIWSSVINSLFFQNPF
jgi:hypothetical protein